jgi:hypothetical protein
MLKRLVVGLVIGVLVGGLAGYGLFQILPTAMAGGFGYVFAAVVGVLVGLVAGKPIWAKGALIEAGLKAFIGALLGCAILFGLRFLGFSVPALAGIGEATIGRHPIGSLLSIATVLAVFYEIDNSGGGDEEDKNAPTRKRVEGGPASKKRVEAGSDGVEEEAPPAAAKKRS